MRAAGIALLLMSSLSATGAAQNLAPSATPTNGAVGSAALNNGYPGAGGAVALPAIANSNAATTTSPLGTTTSPTTASTSSGGATGTGGATSPGAGGSGGGRSGTQTGGATNTAGAATATGSSGGGPNWVLCPPNGAPGIEPLFAGTDLSCAPH